MAAASSSLLSAGVFLDDSSVDFSVLGEGSFGSDCSTSFDGDVRSWFLSVGFAVGFLDLRSEPMVGCSRVTEKSKQSI